MNQMAIAFFGVAAVWMSQDRREHVRRWACVFGLLSQPFWLCATWQAGQWGIFCLCFLYTASWVRGFYVHWVKREAT